MAEPLNGAHQFYIAVKFWTIFSLKKRSKKFCLFFIGAPTNLPLMELCKPETHGAHKIMFFFDFLLLRAFKNTQKDLKGLYFRFTYKI